MAKRANTRFEDILKGGDLRSIGMAGRVALEVKDQRTFDELFKGLYSRDRKVVMRTADAIEKITLRDRDLLKSHKAEVLRLLDKAAHIELKWHVALLAPRLPLSRKETGQAWQVLREWAMDQQESRIVRVNALQGLHDIVQSDPARKGNFALITGELEKEGIPSLNARIRKLRKAGGRCEIRSVR